MATDLKRSMTGNPFSISYHSRGALLVYGDKRQLREVLPLLPAGLKTLVVSVGGVKDLPGKRHIQAVPGKVIQLRGHLGCFRASVESSEGLLDLGPLSPNREELFDLVLDLYDHPLFGQEVPPLGYFRSRGSMDHLEAKLEQLAKLVGDVNKPRYFDFDEQRCAHDRLGLSGCRQCLAACPAGAITSDAHEGIQIDPYLCQGCGSCVLVCPTGAVTYARPRPSVTLQKIADLLEPLHRRKKLPPVLMVQAASAAALPVSVPLLQVTAIGSVGMELWFAALALGASRVIILRSGLLPPTTDRLLGQQVELARSLLKAVGQAPERISLIDDPERMDWDGIPNSWSPLEINALSGHYEKRRLLLMSLKHIASQRGEKGKSLQGGQFGRIELRTSACTLCHACSSICPTGALSQRNGGLVLRASDCVQCGLCVAACPENALTSGSPISLDELLDGKESLLKAGDEPFYCVKCGKAFATRSFVEGSIAHVRSHPMFQGDGIQLLKMCMECRQREASEVNS